MVGSSKNRISGWVAIARARPDPLLHAAGELGRREIGDLGRQADLAQDLDRPPLRLRARQLLDLQQAEGDVLPHRQAVEQRRSLEQHAELLHHLLALAPRQARHLLAVDLDRARIGLEDAEDALEQHRLAGARAADHHHRFGLADLEIEAVQHVLRAEALVQVADPDLGLGRAHRLKKISVTT